METKDKGKLNTLKENFINERLDLPQSACEEKNGFTKSLFSQLNSWNIQYAVLRNFESLPESTGDSDLDIWIKSSNREKFLTLLKEQVELHDGVLVSKVDSNKLFPRFCFLGKNWGMQMDVYYDGGYHKGYRYLDESVIERNIFRFNEINVLSPDIGDIIAFIKEILNNKSCKIEYCQKAYSALNRLSEEQINSLFSRFPNKTRDRIIQALNMKNFDRQSIRSLGRYCSGTLASGTYQLMYGFKQLAKLNRLFRPAGFVIAVLGTDGSGKSTIIHSITPILNEAFHNGVIYEHLRPNLIPDLGILLGHKKTKEMPEIVSDPHAQKISGFASSLFRWGYYLFDYSLGYMIKVFFDKSVRTHVWLFDRYYYDYYIDRRRMRVRLPKWIVRAGEFFVPAPDLILCLGGTPQKIYARKPETSLEEVDRQVKKLKRFADSHKNSVWIDTCTTKEESVKQAMTSICKMMGNRFLDNSLG